MLNSGMRSSLQVGVWWHQSDHALSILLASSWGCVDRLGRSYVTQASPFWLASWKSWEVKTRKSATFPPPPPRLPDYSGAVVVTVVPAFFRLYLPWPAASPIGWSGPHPANQNWGDLYPYDVWWWNWPGKPCVTHNFWLFCFPYSRFYSINIHFMKEYMKIKTVPVC